MLANIFIPKFQRRKIIPVNINFFCLYTRRTVLARHIPDIIILFSLEQIMVNKCAAPSCRSGYKSCHQRPATLLKNSLWRRCFPVNFVKFLRTPFLQNTSGRLLLWLCQERNKTYHKVSFSLKNCELSRTWIRLVNRKDWKPTKHRKHSVLCELHFEEK